MFPIDLVCNLQAIGRFMSCVFSSYFQQRHRRNYIILALSIIYYDRQNNLESGGYCKQINKLEATQHSN